jgi:hypothetical protein
MTTQQNQLRNYLKNNNFKEITLRDNGDLYLIRNNDGGFFSTSHQGFLPHAEELKEIDIKSLLQEVKSLKVEDKEVKKSRSELEQKEQKIKGLHVICLLILSVVALVGLVMVVRSRVRRKKVKSETD